MSIAQNLSRGIQKNVLSIEMEEGIGAVVHRSVGTKELEYFDPFLMFDEFFFTAPAGFPDHPHRGFETKLPDEKLSIAMNFYNGGYVLNLDGKKSTSMESSQSRVTYMMSGACQHEDFCGHRGIISAGDLQWMTAGRGIVHCEMPHGSEEAHGLQLWINLSSKDKMVVPAYQELNDRDIPKSTKNGVTVKVIAGESFGIKSPVYTRTQTMYLDFTMQPGSMMEQAIPPGWNDFAYILSGKALFGPKGNQTEGLSHHALVLTHKGDGLQVENKSKETCRFVLIGGEPINEPVVSYGPYIMNTEQEIELAKQDY